MSSILKKRKIFQIGFGTAAISGEGKGYGFGDISDDEAHSLLLFAVNQGINLFDTAPIYGFGLAEKRLAKLLNSGVREKLYIVSKSGVDWHENGRVNMSNTPEVTQRMLDESLKRLKTDYIDLYMIHWPDPHVDISYPMEVLAKAKREGKILSIGLSNTNLNDLEKAQKIDKIEVCQGECNFFSTPEKSFLESLKKQGIDFMSWGTFDKGILTQRINLNRKFDSSDMRSQKLWRQTSDWKEKVLKVEKLAKKVQEKGHTMLEFCLGYSLFFSNLVLCGMKTCEQIQATIKALGNLPNEEDLFFCNNSDL